MFFRFLKAISPFFELTNDSHNLQVKVKRVLQNVRGNMHGDIVDLRRGVEEKERAKCRCKIVVGDGREGVRESRKGDVLLR